MFSIAGLLAAAMTTRHVLPVWMPDGTSGMGLRRQLGRGAAVLRAHAAASCGTCSPRSASASLVFLVWRHDTLWQTELSSLSPVSAQALALDTQLRDELLAGDERTMVAVTGSDVQAVLQSVEAGGPTARRAGASGSARRLRCHHALGAEPGHAADAAAPRCPMLPPRCTPISVQATQGGSLNANRSGPVRARRAARPRGAGHHAGHRCRHAGGDHCVGAAGAAATAGSTALLPVVRTARLAASEAQRRDRAGLARHRMAAQVFNVGDELRRLYSHYIREAQGQALFGALGVVLLMAAWLRSLPRLLAVCKPLLLAGAADDGRLLRALGVQLGILHLVGLLLVVAVGSNYSLFLDWLRHQGSQRRGHVGVAGCWPT